MITAMANCSHWDVVTGRTLDDGLPRPCKPALWRSDVVVIVVANRLADGMCTRIPPQDARVDLGIRRFVCSKP